MLEVLRAPGARALFAASCVARLPMGALGLLIVLHTKDLTGSYASSGIASAAYAIGLGASNPMLARLIDARGQTAVLRLGAAGAAAAIVSLAVLPAGASVGAIAVAAALSGALQPPIGAAMRSLWPTILRDTAARQSAYSMESIALEMVYICGPVAIVAGIGSWSLRAAIAACAAFVLVGDLAFSAHPMSRAWRAPAGRAVGFAGALRGPGVRVLVGVFALCGLAVGAVEVGVPAGLDAVGHKGATGLVLALWGLGSMAGGFAASRMAPTRDAPRRLARLLVFLGAAHALVALGTGPATYGALLFLAGASIAPTFVCANGLLDRVAPPGTLTESFTWLSTGMTSGVAAGSAIAGTLVDAASPALALALLGVGGIGAAAFLRATAGTALRPALAPAH
jgi:hypothetical protein